MDERTRNPQLSPPPVPEAPAAESEAEVLAMPVERTPGPLLLLHPCEKPPKLFKIGEVMRYSRLSRQTLHNYTMMGLIEESERTESGHRLYPESVFATLERIELLKRHRPLREVRAILEAERAQA